MTEQIVEKPVSTTPVVFEIGATVEVELDAGFKPYMKYLDELKGRPPAFGTRDQTRKKIAMWGKCSVPEGYDPTIAAQELAAQLQALVYKQLEMEGVKPAEDPDAAVFVSTKVTTSIGGPEEW